MLCFFSVTSFFHLLQLLTYFLLKFHHQVIFSLATHLVTIRTHQEPIVAPECLEEHLRLLSTLFFQPVFSIPRLLSISKNKWLIQFPCMGVKSLISDTSLQQTDDFSQHSVALHSMLQRLVWDFFSLDLFNQKEKKEHFKSVFEP